MKGSDLHFANSVSKSPELGCRALNIPAFYNLSSSILWFILISSDFNESTTFFQSLDFMVSEVHNTFHDAPDS